MRKNHGSNADVQTPYHHREGLGRPCRHRAARRPGADLHRSAPGPRSDLAAGLLRTARARPQGPPPRSDLRHHGPFNAHHAPVPADRRPDRQRRRSSSWRPTARSSASPVSASRATSRASSTSSARERPHPARHDGGLRRQPHRDPRRVRCAGVRHRHQPGGARAGHAVPAAAAVEDLQGAGGRRAADPASRPRTSFSP